ncbi:hypothetical protein MHU86_4115 [Fragilaria crotonensis]|nr:hypothetical protein MHU86_4115 [Fragilaria crotonensis]
MANTKWPRIQRFEVKPLKSIVASGYDVLTICHSHCRPDSVLATRAARSGSLAKHNPAHHLRQFSSTSDSDENPGFFGRIKNSFTDRQERKAQEQFANQLEKMANSERWTIKDFQDDLSLVVDSWRTKIPGMTNISQVKSAKQMNGISKAIIEVIGANATASELLEMPRTDKLKVSVKSGASVEDINVMLQQFQGVEVMHQVVRRRKLEGRPIPQDQTYAQYPAS